MEVVKHGGNEKTDSSCGSQFRLGMEHIQKWERKKSHMNMPMEEYWQSPLSPSMMCRLLTGRLMMGSRCVLRIRLVLRETTAFRLR